ncbi:MAG: apolipoprotein N-acyltransferase [Deltaproteobacteria bacterium]|jgi:apolipoprotein N-acyltransferase|nr:apolipoprotein N-acyltransferase [Deltaproteobacteria bacterium]
MVKIFISAFLLAIASYYTNPVLNLIEASLASLFLVWGIKNTKPDKDKTILKLLLWGITFSVLAFYWIPDTLKFFGGFSTSLAYLLFALYCLLSSLQFVLCGILYRIFNKSFFLKKTLLVFPLAWAITEHFFPRFFPWSFISLHITWSSFAVWSQYVPLAVLSFIFFWWIEVLVLILNKFVLGQSVLTIQGYKTYLTKEINYPRILFIAASSFLLLISVGHVQKELILKEIQEADKINVALIQGNISATKERDELLLATYQRLTTQALQLGAELVFWPESAVNLWLPENLKQVDELQIDIQASNNIPLVFGGMTIREIPTRILKFNTVIALKSNGEVAGMYHKKILMPFGEYLPFEKTFPQLRDFSPQTGELDSGDLDEPIIIKVGKHEISLAPLICYEDLIPNLSQAMQKRGANILVNFTNDVWYGDSFAPIQHNLLAMWRAVETRRFLLRSTNTGWTTVINPLGQVVKSLPTFEEGILIAEVAVL